MKNKLFISALIVAAFSANAGKMLAPGVELISEKSWVTGPGTGYVVHHDRGSLSGAFVTAQTRGSVEGRVSQNVMLSADHSLSLNNTSMGSERYTYQGSLCAYLSCIRFQRTFSIAPGKNYNTTNTSYLNTLFPRPASYDVDALTQITGDLNATDTARGTAIITR